MPHIAPSRSKSGFPEFQADFAQDAEILTRENRISDKIYNEIIAVEIRGIDDPIRNEINAAAWGVIMAYYYDPYQMIADALIEEFGETLFFNPGTGHLERSTRPCRFCANEQWRLSEQGCLYDKEEQPNYEAGYLENIVQQILLFSRNQEQETSPLKIQPIIKEAMKLLRDGRRDA